MNTERIFQVCVSTMAVLATLMLGTSQESSVLPIVTLCAALIALIFADYLGWFSLHPFVAGGFGLIAGFYAFTKAQTSDPAGQFVSVANLLIHLQIILLFQKKSIRIYWQLITLSLLQVVVAAALNLFVFFGPLLVLYTGVALCAMITFFVYRETYPLFVRSTSSTSDSLIQIETSHASLTDRSRPRHTLIRLMAFRSFALLSVSTLVVSLAVFLLMPRFGDGVWRASKTRAAATGFSGSVNLDDVGTVFENPSVVMRASFTDETTREPYLMSGTPYLRGSVLDEYAKGKWNRSLEIDQDHLSKLDRPQRIFSAVRQTVNLETSKGSVVFSLSPVCALADTSSSMLIEDRTNETRYFPENDEDPATYSLGTLSLHNGQQSQYSPIRGKLFTAIERRRRLQVERSLPELGKLAAEIVGPADESDTLEQVRLLTSYFTDGSQGFKYSLDSSDQRQPGVDPVVDFVTNHRSGHCQYYASALALMLRSQGIPARVVVGYLASNYNAVGNYYQVREMDAHAWVEAAIPHDKIPDDEILPHEGIHGDAWVRLDPTPGSDVIVERVSVSPWKETAGDTLDYMQLLWSEYVLGLNEKRQRRAIYEPLQEFLKSSAMLLLSPKTWVARWEALLERFRGGLFTRDNIRDSVIAAIAIIVSFFILRSIWGVARRLFSRWRRQKKRIAPQVEFYVRLEKLLSKYGIRRPAEQTPLEFAEVARVHLNGLAANRAVANTPQNTVDLFYRVRFGGGRLDTDEAERLENALGRLKEFLARR